MKFFSTGFFRGLLAQILGTAVGMLFIMGVRVLMGLEAWNREPVVVGGAAIGALAFMVGVGAVSDWLKWARGVATSDDHDPDPNKPNWMRYFSVDYDHKVIGVQYGVTSLLVLFLGGTFALLFRIELAQAGITFLSNPIFETLFGHSGAALYNTFMSLHGIVMIASILLGVGAMTNYLIPLMIGANDMAFPRLNAFAYWINVPGALLVVSSLFLGGFDTGWTGYPPLSVRAELGVQTFLM
ncbi:MAG: cbb3-type cytochrome c oxidase subunit I, partial [Anaerolineae bacterium]|nr:cbb3-type cytochrome c oxidase subunit I [Anaerolineae bacterium]